MRRFLPILFLFLGCSNSTDTNGVQPQGGLRIAEVLPNPVGEDKYKEAITLENTSNAGISLTGWQFRSRGIGMPFAVTTTATSIGAKATWQTTTFPFDRAWLNNDGDSLYLINPSGTVVQSVGWGRVSDGEVVRP
jgi:hypothetical protein